MTTIAREIKQTRPFASKAQEAAVGLIRTADLVRRLIGTVVEPLGITVQQYNVLRILRGAGDDGLPTLEIAERMIEQTPGITRLLDRLEEKKLVSRNRSSSDRRCVYCSITAAGIDLLSRLDRPVVDIGGVSLSSLSKQELSQLVDLLDRARERMNQQFIERKRNS